MSAPDRDVEGFKDYLRDLLNGIPDPGISPDLLIDADDACSFIWVDVESQCFWRIKVEAVRVSDVVQGEKPE